ncbi:MAG: GGDEF domain-containing protein [Candidatus Sumerlaeia bacterium]|nr:GGDEF domain-containing protein [Candidatus Sumerlaeia bacterium]
MSERVIKPMAIAIILIVALAASGVATGWILGAVLSSPIPLSPVPLLVEVAALIVLTFASCGLVWHVLRMAQAYRRQLDVLGYVDELTGLLRRKRVIERLGAEINRGWRSGEPLSCALLAVDHFRTINGQYGQAAGDAVLRTVGRILAETGRQYDAAGRHGSDEFILVYPNTTLEDAARAAERIRRRVAECEFACQGQGFSVTVSAGVTQADPVELEMTDSVIQRADEALRRAKAEGGNRVAAFAPLAVVEHATSISDSR